MKIIIFLSLLFSFSCSHLPEQSSLTRSISSLSPFYLIIGDSNANGLFGLTLHQHIAGWNEADVMSVSIGGGTPPYFNSSMKNKCCGYKVRFTPKGSMKVQILSGSETKNNAVVLPEYGGDIFALMRKKKPSLIIVILGSNNDSSASNAKLLSNINNYDPTVPVYWIGPPYDPSINAISRDEKIRTALNKFPTSPYYFYSSAKVAGHLHPGTKEACEKWINGFISELKHIPR